MRVVVDSTIRFRAGDVPPALRAALRRDLTWPNPARQKLERLGKWAGHLPETITVVEESPSGVVRLPRGALDVLTSAAATAAVPLEITDRRVAFPKVAFLRKREPRAHQARAVTAMQSATQGSVTMPCGGGKTGTALFAIDALGQPALALVHTRDLLEQWLDASRDFLGYTPGQLSGGRGSKVARARADRALLVVATVQTLTKMGEKDPVALERFLARWGALIVDEAHHTPAATFSGIVQGCPARYRFGLTATPDREDGLTPLMDAVLGPRLFEVGYAELVAAGFLHRPDVQVVETDFRYRWSEEQETLEPPERRDYHSCIAALVEDRARNDLVADLAAREARAGHTVLVLSGRVEHCQVLAGLIAAHGVQALALVGETPARERSTILQLFRSGRLPVVCASSLADEGLDVPRLDRVILAFPSRAIGRTTQRLGRIMRPCPEAGKTDAVLYDLVDRSVEKEVQDGERVVAPLLFQYHARRRAYRRLLAETGAVTTTHTRRAADGATR